VGFGQPIPEVPQKLRIVGPHIETITGFLKQALGDGVAEFLRIRDLVFVITLICVYAF
jgi:hypothetical protein